jgi:hypothetical protein
MSRDRRAAEAALDGVLRNHLHNIGFNRQGSLDFVRSNGGWRILLTFPVVVSPERVATFSCNLAVVDPPLQRIVNSHDPEHPLLASTANVIAGCGREEAEWRFSVEDGAQIAGGVASLFIQERMLPTAVRMRSHDSLRCMLEAERPYPFLITDEARVSMLAALYAEAGEADRACILLREAIAQRANRHPKYREQLSQTLGVLCSEAVSMRRAPRS